MIQFVGTKIVNAKEMSRIEYNNLRGWTVPEDEDGNDSGFLVEYIDGGSPNLEGFDGYVSWSPVEVFINSYRSSGNFSFGDATKLAKLGHRVSRAGWNGAGMFAYIVPAASYPAQTDAIKTVFPNHVPYREYWALKTAQNDVATWAPSNSDSLAEDWGIYVPSTFLERLETELKILQNKIIKLEIFLVSDLYESLDDTDKFLLGTQVRCMRAYETVLDSRLTKLKDY